MSQTNLGLIYWTNIRFWNLPINLSPHSLCLLIRWSVEEPRHFKTDVRPTPEACQTLSLRPGLDESAEILLPSRSTVIFRPGSLYASNTQNFPWRKVLIQTKTPKLIIIRLSLDFMLEHEVHASVYVIYDQRKSLRKEFYTLSTVNCETCSFC